MKAATKTTKAKAAETSNALALIPVSPVLAALASAQDVSDGDERLADALPYAEQMIEGGVLDSEMLTKITQAFGRTHAFGYKANEAIVERVEDLAESDDTDGWAALQAQGSEVWTALVRVRHDDMWMGYLIGLAAGLRIAGGAR